MAYKHFQWRRISTQEIVTSLEYDRRHIDRYNAMTTAQRAAWRAHFKSDDPDLEFIEGPDIADILSLSAKIRTGTATLKEVQTYLSKARIVSTE